MKRQLLGIQKIKLWWEEREFLKNPTTDENRIVVNTGKGKTILTPRYRLNASDLGDPRIKEGLRISLMAIAEMNREIRSRDIAFIVLLIPTKELVFRDLVLESMAEIPPEYTYLTENEVKIWEETKMFLERKGKERKGKERNKLY